MVLNRKLLLISLHLLFLVMLIIAIQINSKSYVFAIVNLRLRKLNYIYKKFCMYLQLYVKHAWVSVISKLILMPLSTFQLLKNLLTFVHLVKIPLVMLLLQLFFLLLHLSKLLIKSRFHH
jgi:hypothetical protein